MTSIFRRGWDGGSKAKMKRSGLAIVLDVESFFFFWLKKTGFEPWPWNHAKIYYWQEIFLLPLTSDSETILILWWYQWLVYGLNQTIEHVVNLNVTWPCFCFDFVHSHAQCGCCSIVCLRLEDMQKKQADCKISTKNRNNYDYTTAHTRI